MKNVLIIASSFPPVGGVATQRTLKFVKYLPSFGWSSIVLTIKRGSYTKIFMPVDTSLCSEIPKNVKIYKADCYFWLSPLLPLVYVLEKELKGNKFYKLLGAKYIWKYIMWILGRLVFPDIAVGWYPFAVRRGQNIIKRYDIHMIYSTSPSVVGHLIALKLAKKYNLPWVADFRDPWAYNYWEHIPRPIKLLDIQLERKVLAKANRFVVLEPKIINEIKTLKRNFNSTYCFLIHNGYDEEEFKDVSPHIFNQFTIVYTGHFKKTICSPHHFFAALNLLFQERTDLKTKIKTTFIGGRFPFVERLVKQYNLDGCVQMLGYLEHKEALSYICGASVLFLLTNETKDTGKPFQGKDVIPAKFYEYLRARRPILALVPQDSDCARIIQDTRSGVVIEPTDYQKAKRVILDMYEKYKKGQLGLESNDSLIQQYERKVLTGRLAEIFDNLLSERRRIKKAGQDISE